MRIHGQPEDGLPNLQGEGNMSAEKKEHYTAFDAARASREKRKPKGKSKPKEEPEWMKNYKRHKQAAQKLPWYLR